MNLISEVILHRPLRSYERFIMIDGNFNNLSLENILIVESNEDKINICNKLFTDYGNHGVISQNYRIEKSMYYDRVYKTVPLNPLPNMQIQLKGYYKANHESIRICPICGTTIPIYRYNRDQYICSIDCHVLLKSIYKNSKNIQNFLNNDDMNIHDQNIIKYIINEPILDYNDLEFTRKKYWKNHYKYTYYNPNYNYNDISLLKTRRIVLGEFFKCQFSIENFMNKFTIPKSRVIQLLNYYGIPHKFIFNPDINYIKYLIHDIGLDLTVENLVKYFGSNEDTVKKWLKENQQNINNII